MEVHRSVLTVTHTGLVQHVRLRNLQSCLATKLQAHTIRWDQGLIMLLSSSSYKYQMEWEPNCSTRPAHLR
ncbi:hypothetical protein Plhal703r1_c55g0160571 [Plasmopara halstedii]